MVDDELQTEGTLEARVCPSQLEASTRTLSLSPSQAATASRAFSSATLLVAAPGQAWEHFSSQRCARSLPVALVMSVVAV